MMRNHSRPLLALSAFRQRHRPPGGVVITRQWQWTDSAQEEVRPIIQDMPRKGRPHPRNSFQGSYDMDRLVAAYPSLGPHVLAGPTGRPTIKFADPIAVRALNTALLVADYGVNPDYADILPPNALVPPVPGRADYVHHIADALQKSSGDVVPMGPVVKGMDIGTGASCIYPIIAASAYGWRMIASEIDPTSIASARGIVKSNGHDDLIAMRCQELSNSSIFDGVLRSGEYIDFCMCNPPFYPSLEAFQAENARKLRGLAKSRKRRMAVTPYEEVAATTSTNQWEEEGKAVSSNNFGGTDFELWCKGGEVAFVKRIISESKQYWDRCLWFSSLVSRKDNLDKIERSLFKLGKKNDSNEPRKVQTVHRIAMGAGVKSSTILMWSFLDEGERRDWARMRKWG